LREIYEDLRKHLNEGLVNFALFADVDPISFEDALKKKEVEECYGSRNWCHPKKQNIKACGASKRKKNYWCEVGLQDQAEFIRWSGKIQGSFCGENYKKKKFGIDYQEVFAPVARLETIRIVLVLLPQKG